MSPAHDDQGEQHPEEQVEEVVARIDRGEADTERDADEELPLACVNLSRRGGRMLRTQGRP